MLKSVMAVAFALLLATTPVLADQLVFADDFEDGVLDGWSTFEFTDDGYAFWVSAGELWGRSTDDGDCTYHPGAAGIAMIDGLYVSDVVVDITMTNRNSCGWFGLLLRTTESSWTSWDDVGYWRIFVDPGAAVLSVEYMDDDSPCPGWGSTTQPYDVDVPHYYRVTLVGQTMQLFEKPSPGGDYELRYTTTCETGSLAGYVGVVVGQAAKHASFDSISIYDVGGSLVEQSTWSAIKGLYK